MLFSNKSGDVSPTLFGRGTVNIVVVSTQSQLTHLIELVENLVGRLYLSFRQLAKGHFLQVNLEITNGNVQQN